MFSAKLSSSLLFNGSYRLLLLTRKSDFRSWVRSDELIPPTPKFSEKIWANREAMFEQFQCLGSTKDLNNYGTILIVKDEYLVEGGNEYAVA